MSNLIDILEPITEDNIRDLKPGDWIWDNQMIIRDEHRASLWPNKITEPIGFRLIDILDISDLRWSGKPFMLSDIEHGRYSWVHFTLGRFFKFKKGYTNDKT
jgi:hypothetical protein